jgi:hypothetical protein
MKDKEIRQLLERYYAGNSTIEEERLLKEYFGGTGLSEELVGTRRYSGTTAESTKQKFLNRRRILKKG